jgi:hypothetical protein
MPSGTAIHQKKPHNRNHIPGKQIELRVTKGRAGRIA